MKKSHSLTLCLILPALLLTSPDISAQYTKWAKDTTFHGIAFKKICFREDGRESLYAKGILDEETIIDGYPCHGEVMMNKNGELKIFILSKAHKVAGNVFEKDSKIHILKNEFYCIHCLYEPVVQGYKIRKENYKRPFFMGSTNFSLYPSGKLSFFQPVEDIEIQGVWCRPSSVRGGVKLYESGKLKECTSAKTQSIQDQKVEKNYTLKFDEDGTLTSWEKEKIFG